MSLEFLIGRSLENNLHNLGLLDSCRDILSEHGIDLQPLFDETLRATSDWGRKRPV